MMRIEWNYSVGENGEPDYIWLSVDKHSIIKFASFEEFLTFIDSTCEISETIADEIGYEVMTIGDFEEFENSKEDDSQDFNTKKFLN
jgi:hypothetical protein